MVCVRPGLQLRVAYRLRGFKHVSERVREWVGVTGAGVGGGSTEVVVLVAVTAAMATLTIVCWRKETVGLLLSRACLMWVGLSVRLAPA